MEIRGGVKLPKSTLVTKTEAGSEKAKVGPGPEAFPLAEITAHPDKLPEVLRRLAQIAETDPAQAAVWIAQLGRPELFGAFTKQVASSQTGPISSEPSAPPEKSGSSSVRLTLDPSMAATWTVSAFGLSSNAQPNLQVDFDSPRSAERFGKDPKRRMELFRIIARELNGSGPSDTTFWEHRVEKAAKKILEKYPGIRSVDLGVHLTGFADETSGEARGSIRERTATVKAIRGKGGGESDAEVQHQFEFRSSHQSLQVFEHSFPPAQLFMRTAYLPNSATGPDYWVLQRYFDLALGALNGGQVGKIGLGIEGAAANPMLTETDADRRALAQDLEAMQARLKARTKGQDPETVLRIAFEEIGETLRRTKHPMLVGARDCLSNVEVGTSSAAALPYGGTRSEAPPGAVSSLVPLQNT